MKTQLLNGLADRLNVIDLEGAAHHRGSLLGGWPGEPQPGQRMFETRLAEAVKGLKPNLPLVVEGESRSIGRCQIPKPFWEQMCGAYHLWIDIDRNRRVENILSEYSQIIDSPELPVAMKKLERYLSLAVREELGDCMKSGNWARFVDLMLEHHYDPLYVRCKSRGNFIELESRGDLAQNLLNHIEIISRSKAV